MPTPGGLPMAGEIWELLLPTAPRRRVVVIQRGQGDYWSLRVGHQPRPGVWKRDLWIDPAYWLAQGWLRYIGPAGPQTRAALGLRVPP